MRSMIHGMTAPADARSLLAKLSAAFPSARREKAQSPSMPFGTSNEADTYLSRLAASYFSPEADTLRFR